MRDKIIIIFHHFGHQNKYRTTAQHVKAYYVTRERKAIIADITNDQQS